MKSPSQSRWHRLSVVARRDLAATRRAAERGDVQAIEAATDWATTSTGLRVCIRCACVTQSWRRKFGQ